MRDWPLRHSKVTETVKLKLIDGTELEGTPVHPIWSVDRQDFIPMSELQTGERLQTANGPVAIATIQTRNTPVPVYNIEVRGQHAYEITNCSILVHNANGCRCPGNIGSVAPTTVSGPANVRVRTGASGELGSAFAKIEPGNIGQGTATNASSRAFAQWFGNATDDAGHAIGKNLGGPGGVRGRQIFPQAPSVNRGAFNQFEQQIVRRVEAGDSVFIRVVHNTGTD